MITTALNAQEIILENWLDEGTEQLGPVMADPAKYEVQIIYTRIDRDQANQPSFTSYTYRLDEQQYFYPASSVKMPVAALALEQLNMPEFEDVDEHTPISFGALSFPQQSRFIDETARNSRLTIGHLVRKVFLLSDNEAYNLLYSFVGKEEINKRLHEKGYKNLAIRNRVGNSAFNTETNKLGNPSFFYDKNGLLKINTSPFNDSEISSTALNGLIKGKGFIDHADRLINEPFDFSTKNYISLKELHDLLIALIFPNSIDPQQRFNLTEKQYELIYKAMLQFPQESEYPNYDPEHYDSDVKFFVHGDRKTPMPEGLRIMNKVGYAYGYLTDVAYIIDFNTQTEFILAACIHVNDNEIYNDNKYEYNEIGMPFLAALGRIILEKEKHRKKENTPDLSNLKQLLK
jgi:hypothetical protein